MYYILGYAEVEDKEQKDKQGDKQGNTHRKVERESPGNDEGSNLKYQGWKMVGFS